MHKTGHLKAVNKLKFIPTKKEQQQNLCLYDSSCQPLTSVVDACS